MPNSAQEPHILVPSPTGLSFSQIQTLHQISSSVNVTDFMTAEVQAAVDKVMEKYVDSISAGTVGIYDVGGEINNDVIKVVKKIAKKPNREKIVPLKVCHDSDVNRWATVRRDDRKLVIEVNRLTLAELGTLQRYVEEMVKTKAE